MTDEPIFDHLAVALHNWSDGYDLFVRHLGGRWMRGGNAGAFSPAQFGYHDEMKIELLEPGSEPGNFVSRFLDRDGPGPHHLTFHVPDMDVFVDRCEALGIAVMPGFIDLPGRREAFLHPKATGWGTLVQAIESDERYAGVSAAPDGVPEPGEMHEVCWVALAVPDLAHVESVVVDVLGGRVRERGSSAGRAYALVEWSVARRLLVVEAGGGHPTPRIGVDHVLFGPVGAPLPDPTAVFDRHRPEIDPTIGLHVLEVTHVLE